MAAPYFESAKVSDGRIRESAQLPDRIVKATRQALGRQIPDSLYRSLASFMQGFADRGDPAQFLTRWEAIQRVHQAAKQLHVEMRRAESAFGVRSGSRDSKAKRPQWVYQAWWPLDAPLQKLIDGLDRWLELWRVRVTGDRPRGAPHHGEALLRNRILRQLALHGIPVQTDGHRSAAADVMLAVLGELKERRTPIRRTEWNAWVSECATYCSDYEEDQNLIQRPEPNSPTI